MSYLSMYAAYVIGLLVGMSICTSSDWWDKIPDRTPIKRAVRDIGGWIFTIALIGGVSYGLLELFRWIWRS